MDALVHLLTSVATLRYSHSAFFTLTQIYSHPQSSHSKQKLPDAVTCIRQFD